MSCDILALADLAAIVRGHLAASAPSRHAMGSPAFTLRRSRARASSGGARIHLAAPAITSHVLDDLASTSRLPQHHLARLDSSASPARRHRFHLAASAIPSHRSAAPPRTLDKVPSTLRPPRLPSPVLDGPTEHRSTIRFHLAASANHLAVLDGLRLAVTSALPPPPCGFRGYARCEALASTLRLPRACISNRRRSRPRLAAPAIAPHRKRFVRFTRTGNP